MIGNIARVLTFKLWATTQKILGIGSDPEYFYLNHSTSTVPSDLTVICIPSLT